VRAVKRIAVWLVAIAAGLVVAAVIAMGVCVLLAGQRETANAAEAAPPSGRFVAAGDVSIFVQEAGPADGVPVLFVHGTGAWSETWRESLNTLAGAGYRAIAIDLPPFGYSQRPSPPRYGKGEQGRRILAVLDTLALKQPILVGHSFGGGPTVEAVMLAPERVRGIILVDAALSIRTDVADPPSVVIGDIMAVGPLREGLTATILTNPAFTRRLLQGFIADPQHATDYRVGVYRRP
jgi:pimeloyl-ACP methyl ester carboxylesterase